MIQATSRSGPAAAVANESTHVVNTPMVTGGAADSGGYLSEQKDSKEAATATKFGDVYKQIQAKYGEKPVKPREIKKTLGKDDFLRIMLTQMKNQDPTNPFKAEQMATEIAQFTSVEQLQNVNQNLNKMSTQNKPLEQMSMTNLIGKVVTIDRERFPHIDGENDDLSFNLGRPAGTVHVVVETETGEEVFQKDLGPQNAGEVSFSWDGIKANTLSAKTGNYRYRVDAKDEQGKAIDINPQVQAKVIGVSFEGTEPVFLVGDARHQDKVTMRNIARIEIDNGQAEGGPGSKHAGTVAPKATPNLFSFQKGVGSIPIEASSMPQAPPPKQASPEIMAPHIPAAAPGPGSVQSAPAATTPSLAGLAPDSRRDIPNGNPEKVVDSERGFPNGLKDLDEPPRTDLQTSVTQKGSDLK